MRLLPGSGFVSWYYDWAGKDGWGRARVKAAGLDLTCEVPERSIITKHKHKT